MDVLKKYSIAYKGLAPGNHRFGFEIGDRFFEAFGNPEIKGGKAHAEVDMARNGNVFSLDITIKGEVAVECDRCLEAVNMPVDYSGKLTVRFSETEKESDGEIMWISPNETEINLAQYLYESIYLGLPYQRVHPDDSNGNSTCDPEMLARFRIVSQDEFDRIEAAGAVTESSPWKKLEDVKEKLEK